ncbi:hypothetical protein A3850_007000 [Lewinella sp. 4G2]|nr:hypothetical protein A3850_007000 [Lewinella sp. 4G2]
MLFLLGTCVSAQIQHDFTNLARTRVQYIAARTDLELTDQNELQDISKNTGTEQLDAMRQTLVNLPAFTDARWELDIKINKDGTADTLVNWTVEESRTIFPILSIGGVRGNTYYQVGFNDIHFRGRGQELTAFYQNNDGEHNYLVLLRNQNYRGSRWGYSLESRRYAAVEPVYFPEAAVDYRYSNQSFGAGVSFAPTIGQSLTFGLTTFREKYRKIESGNLETPGPDFVSLQKYLVKMGYSRNRTDRFAERLEGTHHESNVQAVRTVGGNDNFLIAWHDFRYFQLLGNRSNLALRLRTGLSSNNESPFAPFVLDSQFNIRGSGNRIDRGTAQLVLNLEYRYSVWRDRRERFAAQLVGFSDLGTWRSPGGELADLWERESVRHFLGAGVRLISLKAHNAVLRIDYGVDVTDRRANGVVVGFGQYF